ncbi:MAG: ABC transporter permease [Microbacterium sp.]|uniref:ABC transporter permease n=1 Tax=Microbacterium sp. TaxID=51671 RepID=UPI001ACDDBC7|nr:ABC transporter permease [Microbacterium sp.]MBN9177458.1 ABC transporter permease [Microbacterium sp.]
MSSRSHVVLDAVGAGAVAVPTAGRTAGSLGRDVLRGGGPLLLLVVLCIGLTIVQPQFATTSNLITILNQAAVPLVVACGMTVVILMGSIDMSTEGVMATVGVATSLLVANTTNGLDLGLVGVLAALAIGATFGAVSGLLVTRLRIPSLMVTLGMWFVGLGLASLLYPARQSGIEDEGLRALALVRVGGLTLNFFLALAVVAILFAALRWSAFGRTVYGIGGGEPQLLLAGVRVSRYKIGAFAISGVCAALAGVMITAQIGLGSPTAGYDQLFPAISAVVIGGTLLSGGRGGILHTVVGVMTLVVLRNGMLLVGIDPYLQQAVIGVALVVIVAAATWRERGRLRAIK